MLAAEFSGELDDKALLDSYTVLQEGILCDVFIEMLCCMAGALQVNGSRSLLCCRAVKMQMTGLTSCCRKRTYGPPLQLGELSQRRFPNRPFARSGAGCRPSISGWRSSCVGTCWLTGCTQRPRLGSHVNNFMQCFLTRLPGAATRIPMKKKPIVDLDLQRSRHGGSNGILQGSKCTWSS